MKPIRKKLQDLFMGELVSLILFWCCYITWVQSSSIKSSLVVIYPLSILTFILGQGSMFWYLLLRKIDEKPVNEKFFAKVFSLFKKIDGVVLFAYVLIIFANKTKTDYYVLGLAIYIFAIIEYINYFFIRLSYASPFKLLKLVIKGKTEKSKIYRFINQKQFTN